LIIATSISTVMSYRRSNTHSLIGAAGAARPD
jgi:hypothetical protein